MAYTQNPNDKLNDINSNMELNVYTHSTQRMALYIYMLSKIKSTMKNVCIHVIIVLKINQKHNPK